MRLQNALIDSRENPAPHISAQSPQATIRQIRQDFPCFRTEPDATEATIADFFLRDSFTSHSTSSVCNSLVRTSSVLTLDSPGTLLESIFTPSTTHKQWPASKMVSFLSSYDTVWIANHCKTSPLGATRGRYIFQVYFASATIHGTSIFCHWAFIRRSEDTVVLRSSGDVTKARVASRTCILTTWLFQATPRRVPTCSRYGDHSEAINGFFRCYRYTKLIINRPDALSATP